MKKLLYLLFVLLISSCSSNQESQALKDIQASYMETSDFSKEISQQYFNMIEMQWMLNHQKAELYYKQAIKVDSFATVFYDYVGAITTEHYQNKNDNTHNHQFTYADLLKKYQQVSDSINKNSFYGRDDNDKHGDDSNDTEKEDTDANTADNIPSNRANDNSDIREHTYIPRRATN